MRRRIGSGAFATVWLAYDDQLDSTVAVKVLADNWTEDAHVRRRFLEEGRYLRRVESPHVVSVYDAGELDDGRPYLVMTYADRGTLADRLEVGPLSTAESLQVVREAATGLQALHDRDIIHRDVKPANLLFRGLGSGLGTAGSVRVMLGDLGLGKALDTSSRLTIVGGTPSFVAPEQAAGESPDPRADQYSLASLTYLLLTGRPAYRHASLSAAAEPGPVPPLTDEARSWDPAVEDVVRRGLAPEREDRFDDVTGYAEALAAAVTRQTGVSSGSGAPRTGLVGTDASARSRERSTMTTASTPRPDPAPGPVRESARRRGRSVAVVAGLLALVIGSAVGYAVEQRVRGDVEVLDSSRLLSVRVPDAWDAHVRRGDWQPPGSTGEYPALSVGTQPDWVRSEGTGQGVFLGVEPGRDLPAQLPQHPECGAFGPLSDDPTRGRPTLTQVWSDCPGGLRVERLVQVNAGTQLRVQARTPDRATAARVLASVRSRSLT